MLTLDAEGGDFSEGPLSGWHGIQVEAVAPDRGNAVPTDMVFTVSLRFDTLNYAACIKKPWETDWLALHHPVPMPRPAGLADAGTMASRAPSAMLPTSSTRLLLSAWRSTLPICWQQWYRSLM
jgi:hypothetical protein